jgi:ABC-type Mn2+/Zn2+ transport system permease subunit
VVLFGLLVLPPLTARLFARTMWMQLNISVALGFLATLVGFAIAVPNELVLGPTIVVVSGALLLVAYPLHAVLHRLGRLQPADSEE